MGEAVSTSCVLRTIESTIDKETKVVDQEGWRLMERTMDEDGMAIEYVWFNESLLLLEWYFWLNSSELPRCMFKANRKKKVRCCSECSRMVVSVSRRNVFKQGGKLHPCHAHPHCRTFILHPTTISRTCQEQLVVYSYKTGIVFFVVVW